MILYRPVGTKELERIRESGYAKFPPRLKEQPIFYPVLSEEYAGEIAGKWNVKYNEDHRGYVTRFEVDDEYAGQFKVHRAGRSYHEELWVPAEELEEFNRHILGRIEVVREYGDYEIVSLRDRPEWKERAARWFHEKWGIPLKAYEESMEECLEGNRAVPQWYLAVAVKSQDIAGGLGVIDNDFHDRKDLTPNVCAVYVEQAWRCQGIAGALLDYVCRDMREREIHTLYLLTDHTSFYERYGWEFLCMVSGDGEEEPSRMYVHRGDPTVSC